MKVDVKKQEAPKKKEITLDVKIPYKEIEPILEKTAKKLGQDMEIDGFRKGKAPYDVLKKKIGEMQILQSSIQTIIDKSLHESLQAEDIKLFITPQIDLEKLAPQNDIEYKATIHLLPELTLKNWEKISVKPEKANITEKQVEDSLKTVISSMATEKEVDRKSKEGDVIILDFDVLIDNVVIENGSAKDYNFETGQNSMIPGFEEEVLGMKAGEEKAFKLKFPKDYPHKKIAGKEAEFKVKVKKVLEKKYPEINDELAKKLKYENKKELREAIKKNLENEAKKKTEFKTVNDMFEELLKKAKFDAIHDAFIDEELKKMINELKHKVQQQGGKFENYLEHIKKSEEDLKKEMRSDAEKRVQVSLIIKEIVDKNDIKVEDKDIDEEIANYLKSYGQTENEEAKKATQSKRFRNYIEQTLLNKKAINFLKEKLIKE